MRLEPAVELGRRHAEHALELLSPCHVQLQRRVELDQRPLTSVDSQQLRREHRVVEPHAFMKPEVTARLEIVKALQAAGGQCLLRQLPPSFVRTQAARRHCMPAQVGRDPFIEPRRLRIRRVPGTMGALGFGQIVALNVIHLVGGGVRLLVRRRSLEDQRVDEYVAPDGVALAVGGQLPYVTPGLSGQTVVRVYQLLDVTIDVHADCPPDLRHTQGRRVLLHQSDAPPDVALDLRGHSTTNEPPDVRHGRRVRRGRGLGGRSRRSRRRRSRGCGNSHRRLRR